MSDSPPPAVAVTTVIAVAKVGGYPDRNFEPPPSRETMAKSPKKVQTWAEGYELHS